MLQYFVMSFCGYFLHFVAFCGYFSTLFCVLDAFTLLYKYPACCHHLIFVCLRVHRFIQNKERVPSEHFYLSTANYDATISLISDLI